MESPSAIYSRIYVYIFYFTILICNSIYIQILQKTNGGDDQRIFEYIDVQGRYYTVWNVLFIMLYCLNGLVCDMMNLKTTELKSTSREILEKLTSIREALFAGVVAPGTFIVSSVFWSHFSYDRELIFPKFLDGLMPNLSNHIVHTTIVLFVLWEFAALPRKVPKSHWMYLGMYGITGTCFFCTLFYTYYERGFWLYPVCGRLKGTLYLPLWVTTIYFMGFVYYYMQWPITAAMWSVRRKDSRKMC